MSAPRPLPDHVFHLTPVAALPRIILSGGLVPPINQQVTDDACTGSRWGNNAEIGRHLVCTSLAPHWGVLKNQFAHIPGAVLRLDTWVILNLDDVRPCPMNSASPAAKRFLQGTNDRVGALGDCLAADRATWRDVEILVAGDIPLTAITDVVLTRECCEAGWEHGIVGLLASAGVTAQVGSRLAGKVFPRDYLAALGETPRPPFRASPMAMSRVYEIAQAEGLPSANVLARLQRAGYDVTSASSKVDREWAMHILSPSRNPQPDHPMPNPK